MCIVHGSQMQTRLCELWRRKEVGTEWAAGLLGLLLHHTTSSSGRAVDNICHALSLRNAAVLGGVGALNPFRIIFFTHGLPMIKKGKHYNQLSCDDQRFYRKQ